MKKFLVFAVIASSAVGCMASDRDGSTEFRYNRTNGQMGQVANAYGWNTGYVQHLTYLPTPVVQPVYSPVSYQQTAVVYYQAPAPVVHQTSPYGPPLYNQPVVVVQQPVLVQPTFVQVCRQYPTFIGTGQIAGMQTVCQ